MHAQSTIAKPQSKYQAPHDQHIVLQSTSCYNTRDRDILQPVLWLTSLIFVCLNNHLQLVQIFDNSRLL